MAQLQVMQHEIHVLRAAQLATASQPPVQVIVQNSACASTAQMTMSTRAPGHTIQRRRDDAKNSLRDFLASPVNRIALYTAIYLSFHFVHSYLAHKHRMTEMQQRIDANAFLRFKHMLTNQLKASEAIIRQWQCAF